MMNNKNNRVGSQIVGQLNTSANDSKQHKINRRSLLQSISTSLFCLMLAITLPFPIPVSAATSPLNCELPDGDIDGDECITQDVSKNNGSSSADCTGAPTCVGNPINVGTGSKYENEVDYISSDYFPIILSRYYNSADAGLSSLGISWRMSYSRVIATTTNPNSVEAIRDDGKTLSFTQSGGVWRPDGDVNSKLVKLASGWQYTTGLDDVEIYNADGHLTSITNRFGLVQALTYDAQGHLLTVTNSFGRKLTFTYTGSLVSSVTAPNGGVYSYGYDSKSNLVSVTYPDQNKRQFTYENATFPSALTGVIDEKGNRFATFTYVNGGTLSGNNAQAVSTEHAGGVEKYTLDYSGLTNSYVTVTDPLGATHKSTFVNVNNVALESGNTYNCPSCATTTASRSISYDANGNITSQTDFNGNVTTYTYDSTRNLELSHTEASGTPQARTISTTWHTTFRLPTKITEPNRVTTFTYDSKGDLTQRTVAAGTLSRTWKFTYNTNGQVTSVDSPRDDVIDISQYAYDTNGNLTTVTNALGQVTKITSYNANGQPLTIVDPNGLQTTLVYDIRGRLTSRNVGNELTSYLYDAIGQVIKVVFPDSSFIAYSYDNAHRLVQETDSLGNKIVYTLDAMGNPLKTQTYDPQGNLARVRSHEFDALSRLKSSIGAQNQITAYSYDTNSNVTSVADPLNHTSSNQYDALNRLVTSKDPLLKPTQYQYDSNNNLNTVTDPRNLSTQYVYDGLGNPIKVISPDTGTTLNTFDAAGNILTSTDARNQTTTYTYDALNRVKSMSFNTGVPITFSYDIGTNSIGHLVKMTDPTGNTVWNYDQHGRITRKIQTVGSLTQTVGYSYNAAGRLASMTYPSGKVLQVSYNSAGQVSQLALDQKTILSNILYTPFHALKSWLFGNNLSYQRSFDQDGRLIQYPLGGQVRSLSYDTANKITDYTYSNTTLNQHFGYDALNRITALVKSSGAVNFTYDDNGNRLSLAPQTANTAATNYSYDTGSNRLIRTSTGTTSQSVSYGSSGNTVSDGKNSYGYNTRGRLIQVTNAAGITTFNINGLGQRVRKVAPTVMRRFIYDEAGHLLGEYTETGRLIRENVYLGDTPVATVTLADVFYVYADHLNAPRVVVNNAGKSVWQWDSDPFGVTLANTDPDGDGVQFEFNVRFPGQYFDAETGLHYNYFRDYNPSTGRYVQSDPIGLGGGINTYGYVGGNPLSFIDSKGKNPLLALYGLYLLYAEEIITTGVIVTETTVAVTTGVPNPTSLVATEASLISTEAQTAALATRANTIHSILDPIAANSRTTAVLETNMCKIVAAGGRDLSPAQRAILTADEIAAKAPGVHAEVTALQQAQAMGATPEALAASRAICPACAAFIEANGGYLTSPTTAIFNLKP
jgi:RHS repeat-associated protein